MSSYKRPRGIGIGKRPTKRARTTTVTTTKVAPVAVRRPFRPGYDRTGGFYRISNSINESKFLDTALSFNLDFTGEVPATGQLALIPQGDTESTRDGRIAYITSIQIKGYFVLVPAAAAVAATTAYVFVVLDTQTNGAAAAVTDVLTGNNLGSSMINLANSQRFKILKKIIYDMNSPAGVTTAYNNVSMHCNWYKKIKIPMVYSGTAGAIGEIRSNNLFLLAGTNTSSGDDLISFAGTCRIRFHD